MHGYRVNVVTQVLVGLIEVLMMDLMMELAVNLKTVASPRLSTLKLGRT